MKSYYNWTEIDFVYLLMKRINNNTFYTKIEQFKKQLINHISGDCPICKFEGEICTKCCSFKKIFFYDIENIFYCKICRKSYHKKCIGLVGHVH